jgi:hypothetical protein
MSKKTFKGGIDSLLEQPEPRIKRAIERTKKKLSAPLDKIPTSQLGLKEDETRATFIVKKEALKKLKEIAYWDRTTLKDIIEDALEEAVKKYVKLRGELRPIPDKKKR